jgi:hypothetical protein
MKAPISPLIAVTLGLCMHSAHASDSVASELAHLTSGGLVASAVTAIADHYGAENRAWIGFGTAVGLSFVAEAIQVASNGSSQLRPSALDFTANLLGAALGAYVTDRYVLAPAISTDAQGHRTLSLSMRMAF